MNQIERCDWLAEPGLPVVSREKNFPLSQIINPLLAKVFGEDDYVLASFFFFASLWTSVSVHKHPKKELGQYPAIPTSRWAVNPYIYRYIELSNYILIIAVLCGSVFTTS